MVETQEFTFPSSDGVHQIWAQWWRPGEGTPRGVLQLVHGISEYIGRYDAFARTMARQGWAVVGHDHLGHGRTVRDPSEFGWFADRDGWRYVLRDTRNLRLLAGQAYPGVPYFILGHSMGSFVTRGYLLAYPGTVDGAVLSGTGQESAAAVGAAKVLSGLLSRTMGPRGRSKLINALSLGAYNRSFRPNRTGADWICRDPAVVDAYTADPFCQFLPSVSMYHDMMTGLQMLVRPENLKRLDPDTPVYLFAGDRDPVGANGAGVQKVAGLFRQYGVKDVTVKLYPGGRHEMLNETNKEQVYADTSAWLEAHLAKVGTPADPGQ